MKQKKRKLADRKTRHKATKGIGYEINYITINSSNHV